MLVYRSLPKLGKLNFASDFCLNEPEAAECGLENFFEKVTWATILCGQSFLKDFLSYLVFFDHGEAGTAGNHQGGIPHPEGKPGDRKSFKNIS